MPFRIAAAATSVLTPSGTEATTLAGATQYSAYAPTALAVTTRSPECQAMCDQGLREVRFQFDHDGSIVLVRD